MQLFIAIAVAMTAAALSCVLYPLLRTVAAPARPRTLDNLDVLRAQVAELERARADGNLDAAGHAEALAELKRRVHDEAATPVAGTNAAPQRLLAGALALLVPLVAAGVYYHAGSPAALTVMRPAATPSAPQHEVTAADVSTLIQGLSERLRQEPANADGWYMLARSYTAIGRYQDAAQAYERLLVLVPDDAPVLADYADVLATVQDGSLTGKPERLAQQALALDPDNAKALALAGSAAFQLGEWDPALRHWQRALALIPAEEPMYASIQRNIAEARQRAGGVPPAPAAAAAAAVRALTGTVTLAPALAKEAKPDDAVFIFARAVDGPRAPLAVRRVSVRDLPYRFVLDDTLAMAPTLKLSGAARVVVTARVSRSGSATPAPGDLEGDSAAVASDAADVAVFVGRRLP